MSGVPEIDRQHKELVNMFNRLNEAVQNNESRANVYRIIDEVVSLTRAHFSTEEEIMMHTGYPELEAHREKHKELITEALQLKKKLDYMGEQMFTDWLSHWPFTRVLAHIQYADKQAENHILERAQWNS